MQKSKKTKNYRISLPNTFKNLFLSSLHHSSNFSHLYPWRVKAFLIFSCWSIFEQRTKLMIFQYGKDLNNPTKRMRQIHNTEHSDDIKKQNKIDKKPPTKLNILFSCFYQSATPFLSPKHLDTHNITEISCLMVSQIHSEQINAAQHLRDPTALQVHFGSISDGE